jgi:DNA mismatch endonuclease (patch repair protein)
METAPDTRKDNLTPVQREHTMRQVRSRDTRPELEVRRIAHRMGYRYRLHCKELPGNPDLVFPSRRKIIFVHGCFWHGHDCKAGQKRPKTNESYWMAKLARNRARDAANQSLLREQGWAILIVWECQLRSRERLAEELRSFLGPRGLPVNA